jgi:uncharacterized protein
LGFYDVRVRHHELKPAASAQVSNDAPKTSGAVSHLARIEVGPDQMPKLLADAVGIVAKLKQIGYAHVTLDLQGYRRGSLNEVLKASVG